MFIIYNYLFTHIDHIFLSCISISLNDYLCVLRPFFSSFLHVVHPYERRGPASFKLVAQTSGCRRVTTRELAQLANSRRGRDDGVKGALVGRVGLVFFPQQSNQEVSIQCSYIQSFHPKKFIDSGALIKFSYIRVFNLSRSSGVTSLFDTIHLKLNFHLLSQLSQADWQEIVSRL